LDTVSRQIFRDIQETQFSVSKMEVNIHLKNAFQAELETEGSCLATILPRYPQKSRVRFQAWREPPKEGEIEL